MKSIGGRLFVTNKCLDLHSFLFSPILRFVCPPD